MIVFEQAVVIIVLALVGYWVFAKLRLLSPALMGPMVAIGAYQIFVGGFPELPAILISTFQIMIGLSVGTKITKNNIQDIRNIWLPSLIIGLYTLASTAIMTLLIQNFTSDYATSLFSAAPGGITEMTVVALSYDTDIAIISTFQFVRLLVILSTIPFIARMVHKRSTSEKKDITDEETPSKQVVSFKQCRLYGFGIIGGLFLIFLKFPGGGVIGALAALGVANIISGENYSFPSNWMRIALLGLGVTIGLEFSAEMISEIHQMFLPILGFSVVIVLGNLLIGWLIRHITRWDMITCILCSAPGGLSQMIVVGEEMHADTLKISILQLVRVVTIIICIPVVAALVFH